MEGLFSGSHNCFCARDVFICPQVVVLLNVSGRQVHTPPRKPLDMATNVHDKSSSNLDSKTGVSVHTLDEKRRAVLAEIDNAKFSHVFLIIISSSSLIPSLIIAGFTSRSVWSLVLASSQMRKFSDTNSYRLPS